MDENGGYVRDSGVVVLVPILSAVIVGCSISHAHGGGDTALAFLMLTALVLVQAVVLAVIWTIKERRSQA